jgi:hypothetical protein
VAGADRRGARTGQRRCRRNRPAGPLPRPRYLPGRSFRAVSRCLCVCPCCAVRVCVPRRVALLVRLPVLRRACFCAAPCVSLCPAVRAFRRCALPRLPWASLCRAVRLSAPRRASFCAARRAPFCARAPCVFLCRAVRLVVPDPCRAHRGLGPRGRGWTGTPPADCPKGNGRLPDGAAGTAPRAASVPLPQDAAIRHGIPGQAWAGVGMAIVCRQYGRRNTDGSRFCGSTGCPQAAGKGEREWP